MTTIERIAVQSAHEPRPRRRALIAAVAAVALAVGVGVGVLVGRRGGDEPGSDVSDRVMLAWRTADPDDVRAAYATDAVFVFDGEELAVGVDDVTAMIDSAVNELGNTYEVIGPVSATTADDGDLYVSFLVEVTGPGHPNGSPIVGFYRVHDGLVVRHAVIDAEHI